MGRIKMTNEQKIKFIKENIQIYIDKNPKKNTPLVEGWENFDDVKLQDLYIKVQNAQRDFSKSNLNYKSLGNEINQTLDNGFPFDNKVSNKKTVFEKIVDNANTLQEVTETICEIELALSRLLEKRDKLRKERIEALKNELFELEQEK